MYSTQEKNVYLIDEKWRISADLDNFRAILLLTSSQHHHQLMANGHNYGTYYDYYSPRTQIPEDSFHGTYSRYELENARSSLVNNVLGATGGIWFQLKYKLGMCNFNDGAGYNRELMHQCMFDMHSSEWCHSPLNDKRSTMTLPPFRTVDEITSNHKPADASSGSSCGISPANDSQEIVISDSDADTDEFSASSPKDSTLSDRQQKEILIDSEPDYSGIALLYEN